MSVFPKPRTPTSCAPGSVEKEVEYVESTTPVPTRRTRSGQLFLVTPRAHSHGQRRQFSDLFCSGTPRFENSSQESSQESVFTPRRVFTPRGVIAEDSVVSTGYIAEPGPVTPCNSRKILVPRLAGDGDGDAHIIHRDIRLSDPSELAMTGHDYKVVEAMNRRFPFWYEILYNLFFELLGNTADDATVYINYLQLLSYMIGYNILTSRDVPPPYQTLQEDQITPEHQKVFIEAVFTGLSKKINQFDDYMMAEYNSYIAQIKASDIYRQAIGVMGLGFRGDDRGGALNDEIVGEGELEGGSTRRRLRRHHRVKTIKKSHKKRPTARRRRRHRRSSKARSTRRR
jgi:hypothetical protein